MIGTNPIDVFWPSVQWPPKIIICHKHQPSYTKFVNICCCGWAGRHGGGQEAPLRPQGLPLQGQHQDRQAEAHRDHEVIFLRDADAQYLESWTVTSNKTHGIKDTHMIVMMNTGCDQLLSPSHCSWLLHQWLSSTSTGTVMTLYEADSCFLLLGSVLFLFVCNYIEDVDGVIRGHEGTYWEGYSRKLKGME